MVRAAAHLVHTDEGSPVESTPAKGVDGSNDPGAGSSAEEHCLHTAGVKGSNPFLRTIAALYVEPEGAYQNLDGVDPWDEVRDARQYSGPHPVVAHPPCQRWGALATVNYARWGGEHNRPGNDGGCFLSALSSVRRWGGVLEHPAKSKAFSFYGLPTPKGIGWQKTPCGGWVCEVWQSAYGHRANKATWLYVFGTTPPELNWSRPSGSHQIGFHDQRGKGRNKPTLGRCEALGTPVAFRDILLSIAASAVSPNPYRA